MLGLQYIQNYRYSILIIIPDHALVSVGRVRDNHAVFLACKFGRIIILLESGNLSLFHLDVFVSLVSCHFHATILNDVLRLRVVRKVVDRGGWTRVVEQLF